MSGTEGEDRSRSCRRRGLAAAGPVPVLALLAVLAAGCDQFVAYRTWDGTPQIEPARAEILTGQKASFEALGGKPPYSFSLVSGAGSLRAEGSRVEYGAPESPGQAVVRVTDDLGSRAEARVEVVVPPLTLAPAQVTMRIGGTCAFRVEGGYPPYAFSVPSGGGSIGTSSGIYSAPWALTTAIVRVTDSREQARDAVVEVRLPWLPFPREAYGR